MVYKHVIGLKTDVSQSNLGGNTDSNHLIPGVVGHFPSVSLSRRPVQLVILIKRECLRTWTAVVLNEEKH